MRRRTVTAFATAAAALACVAYPSRAFAQDLEPPAAGPPPVAAPPAGEPAEESQDSGLGLEWVYINGGGGGAYTNMQSLSETNLALQKSESSGGEFDIGAGVRVLFLSVGLRARDLALSDYNLWELDAEVALHMKIWRIDPYLGARGGYVNVGSFSAGTVTNDANGTNPDVSVHGFNVGPMFGIDFYLTSFLSLGAEVNAEVLLLQRPPAPLPAGVTAANVAMLPAQQQQLYNLSGSSVGLGVMGNAHLGIHF